jgi:hypothetical protein
VGFASAFDPDQNARDGLGVLAPEHRHTGLGLLGPILLEALGRAIGAEQLMVPPLAELTPRTQAVWDALFAVSRPGGKA